MSEPMQRDVEAHWNDHIIVDQWGNSVFKRDTPGCHFCDALSGRLARTYMQLRKRASTTSDVGGGLSAAEEEGR